MKPCCGWICILCSPVSPVTPHFFLISHLHFPKSSPQVQAQTTSVWDLPVPPCCVPSSAAAAFNVPVPTELSGASRSFPHPLCSPWCCSLASQSGDCPLQQPETFPFISREPLAHFASRQRMEGLIVQGFSLTHCQHLCGQKPRQAGWISHCYSWAVSSLTWTELSLLNRIFLHWSTSNLNTLDIPETFNPLSNWLNFHHNF